MFGLSTPSVDATLLLVCQTPVEEVCQDVAYPRPMYCSGMDIPGNQPLESLVPC